MLVKKLAVYVLLFLGLSLALKFAHDKYVDLIEQNKTLFELTARQAESLSNVQKSIELAQQQQRNITLETQKIRGELRKTIHDLDKSKSENDIILKKMSLVEQMINKSFDEFIKQMSCDTGAKEWCEQKE